MSEVQICYFDLGNTRLKLWLCDQHGQLLEAASVLHEGLLLEVLDKLPETFGSSPSAILGASVMSLEHNGHFMAACERKWARLPRFARTQKEQFGIRNAYGDGFDRLGVDRWLAMLGCLDIGVAPTQQLCVVDCGTAITLDLLSVRGSHEGGYIIPGLTMMRESLFQHTANVRHDPLPGDAISPGKSTAEAVEHGALLAVISLVERLVSGPDKLLVLTGGDAFRLVPMLTCPYREEPHLLLKGLQRYFSDAGIS